MTLSKDQLMTEAMKLDPLEREALAEELMLSVEQKDRQIDAAWLAEIQRRTEAYQTGKTTSEPVEDVINEILNKGRP